MLKSKIEDALNEQIAVEAYSSNHYLSMSSWCEKQGMQGCAEYFRRQAEEERMHMLKIIDYINEMDGFATIPAVEQPPKDFASIQAVFQDVEQQEKNVTQSIHAIVALCYEVKDHATLNFMQWYVDEQREEEALVRTIQDKIKLIGAGAQSLYYIDKEVAKINAQQAAAETKNNTNQ